MIPLTTIHKKIKNIVYIRKRGVRVERDGRVSGSVRTLTL